MSSVLGSSFLISENQLLFKTALRKRVTSIISHEFAIAFLVISKGVIIYVNFRSHLNFEIIKLMPIWNLYNPKIQSTVFACVQYYWIFGFVQAFWMGFWNLCRIWWMMTVWWNDIQFSLIRRCLYVVRGLSEHTI